MFHTQEFRLLKGLTDTLVQRQEILSNNLANIETQNYVRQDVDFGQVLSNLKNNIGSENNDSVISRARYRDYSNPITLESEMAKMYDNHLRYVLVVKAISHHFEHMKKALEVRGA